ncbi:LIM and calponin homology domains-containing protein 1-like isoform X2 [Orbicella faveolata]|uniref:LIM and calponin homology domains-containing protein 1-like isoform X2 n=1 Tax=Orbicella faveolata TaxID=48498 RepID=UPI0009E499B3|nr:LIM and calponin homology domains-containing protein 1-like isoform X2 [Orbicella faveolata]
MASSLEPLAQATNRTLNSRELREKYNSYIHADPALVESRRWIEEVTRREFKSDNFRESLADGILLCELIEIVGGTSLGRINRLPTAYAGIDNLNLFFKACERLGLKRLHLFDTTDLQEVTSRRGESITSRAKETQRRLQNVAITILWLAKAARKQGYQGPALDVSCFNHLIPEAHFHSKKQRGTRKRHSLGDLETKSRGSENIPQRKRDRVFDKIDIKDRKEKFQSLEKEAKQESAALDLNRRRSTGGILKRQEEERIRRYKDNNQLKSNMPDPKFHEKKELFNRRDHVVSITSDKI